VYLLSTVGEMLLRDSNNVSLLGNRSDSDVDYGADTDRRDAVAWSRQFQGDLSQLFRREYTTSGSFAPDPVRHGASRRRVLACGAARVVQVCQGQLKFSPHLPT